MLCKHDVFYAFTFKQISLQTPKFKISTIFNLGTVNLICLLSSFLQINWYKNIQKEEKIEISFSVKLELSFTYTMQK